MITTEQIDAMPIEQIQLDFSALMAAIVAEHGDDEVRQATVEQEEVSNAN